MRITTSSPQFTALPPRAGDLKPDVKQADALSEVQTVLFGSALPRLLDIKDHPELLDRWRVLKRFKTKISAFVGDRDQEARGAAAL